MNIEELRAAIGAELGLSAPVVIDQRKIDEFADCTGDRQWIHVDVERATRESPFGGTIAHGYLTLALLAPATFELLVSRMDVGQAVNYGLEKVRFIAPVRSGKTVRIRMKVIAVSDRGPGRHLVEIENTAEIEGEPKPAFLATTQVLLIG